MLGRIVYSAVVSRNCSEIVVKKGIVVGRSDQPDFLTVFDVFSESTDKWHVDEIFDSPQEAVRNSIRRERVRFKHELTNLEELESLTHRVVEDEKIQYLMTVAWKASRASCNFSVIPEIPQYTRLDTIPASAENSQDN